MAIKEILLPHVCYSTATEAIAIERYGRYAH